MNKKDFLILLLIIIPGLVFRLYRLDFNNGQPIFDEQAYYQKAALSYLENVGDPNFEHPPLGKEIIAAGIKTFGDNPLGWRLPSLVFSLLGLAAVYFLFRDIFYSRFIGGATAALLSLDFTYFIHSRMGTMETIYLFFLWGSVYFLYKYICIDVSIHRYKIINLVLGSVFFGLAFSTKWTAVLVPIPVFLILLAKRRFREWLGIATALTISTGVIYYLTYLPYLGRNSIWDLINLQYKIFNYWATFSQKTGIKFGPVEYLLNHAFSWPLNPSLVYHATKHQDKTLQLVWALYNPIIYFPSILLLIKDLCRRRLKNVFGEDRFVALFILGSFVPWLFVTRIEYAYYLLPALPFIYSFLARRLHAVFQKDKWLFASVAVSIILVSAYFYPLISNLAISEPLIKLYPFSIENKSGESNSN